ncbi:hypothetical protein AgCh_033244 [Apium graveolens]
MRVRGDKSKVSSFNCQAYGNFASECRKPRRDREEQKEENLTLIQEDEPVLLIAEVRQTEIASMLLKGKSIVPKLRTSNDERRESHIWYFDNGTSNHMTGARGMFKDLDERVTGKVRFGDGSTVNIVGKGKIEFQSVRHSTYILNRFPTHALSGKTPYEVWYGKKPDLSHVKNIRSVAFMKVPSVHMKLDDRGNMTSSQLVAQASQETIFQAATTSPSTDNASTSATWPTVEHWSPQQLQEYYEQYLQSTQQ